MKISISATNPCHLFPMAVELARLGALGQYYSGYPRWKLGDTDGVPIRTHSWRTNIVYGLIKFLPSAAGPARAISSSGRITASTLGRRHLAMRLRSRDAGAMPRNVRAARKLGVRTVLNHATGPVRDWVRIMEPEYTRVGLKLRDATPYDAADFAREDEEYALADWHCAASTVVRDQLLARGIPAERVWVVPYGADRRVFHPDGSPAPERFRIVFAGLLGLRKGLKTLLDALTLLDRDDWQIDFYGGVLGESNADLDRYLGRTPLKFHGPVSQAALADAFRAGSVLVLPSLEEGFGLVVPQALSCGLPCIVSDRVGAKDLIRKRDNGSVFAVQDSQDLASKLLWWSQHPRRVPEVLDWADCARQLNCEPGGSGESSKLSGNKRGKLSNSNLF